MLLDILEILESDYGNPFNVNLGGVDYQMEVDKNIAGFLTVSLWDVDGNALVNGEKMVYGRRLFSTLNSDDYPDEDLVPLDPSGTENDCNTDNFGVSVFLVSVCVFFAFDSIDLVFVFFELVFEFASATFFESSFSS